MNASYSGRPISEMAFSSRFCRVGGGDLAGLLLDQRAGLVGGEVPAEELADQAQTHRELVGLPVVQREHAVLVAGELGELPHVVPHPLVAGVEQVGTVAVHLDAGLRFGFGVRVAADVRTAVDDEDPLVQLGGHPLGDRQAEEPGTDDEEVESVGWWAGITSAGRVRIRGQHRQSGYPTEATAPEFQAAQVAIRSRFHIVTLVTAVTSVPSTTYQVSRPLLRVAAQVADLYVHILRRLPCRTDVDAGSRQP